MYTRPWVLRSFFGVVLVTLSLSACRLSRWRWRRSCCVAPPPHLLFARYRRCRCRRRLLSAFGDFLESLPACSEAKLLCMRFVCRLTTTLLSGSAGGDDSETSTEVCRWLRSLPELLCLWGGEFPRNSAAALGALVELAKHALPPQQPLATDGGGGGVSHGEGKEGKSKGKTGTSAEGGRRAGERRGGAAGGRGGAWSVASSELLRSIEPTRLVEFFGGQGFLSLPVASQMDAISLLYHLPSLPAGVVSELAATCSDPAALDRDVRSFGLEVRVLRRLSSFFTPSPN